MSWVNARNTTPAGPPAACWPARAERVSAPEEVCVQIPEPLAVVTPGPVRECEKGTRPAESIVGPAPGCV